MPRRFFLPFLSIALLTLAIGCSSNDPLPDPGTGYDFMGVASPLPLKRIFFNEDMGGDDICFRNIWIAVRTEG